MAIPRTKLQGAYAHKPTAENSDMSDLKKITEDRKVERESSYGVDKRKLRALEDIADALEGIRRDLTSLVAGSAQMRSP